MTMHGFGQPTVIGGLPPGCTCPPGYHPAKAHVDVPSKVQSGGTTCKRESISGEGPSHWNLLIELRTPQCMAQVALAPRRMSRRRAMRAMRGFGQTPEPTCKDYTVRADSRCLDDDGNFFPALNAPIGSVQKWYHRPTGKCVEPPPIVCDVNAENIPPSCPPQMKYDSTSHTGCALSQQNVPTWAWVVGGLGVLWFLTKDKGR